MAKVQLRAVHFNVVADPSDQLSLRFVTEFGRERGARGQVVRTAGGRTRLIEQAGRSVGWSLGFRSLTRAQVEWLEDHAGDVLCVRDDRGHKVFGTFLGVDSSEHLYNEEADVSLSFTELSFSEAV